MAAKQAANKRPNELLASIAHNNNNNNKDQKLGLFQTQLNTLITRLNTVNDQM